MSQPMHVRLAAKEGKPCACKGCPKPVWRLSRFCKIHNDAYGKYGSPTGKRLKRKDHYAREHQLVAELVKNNPQHPGVLRAIEWLDQFMPPEDHTQVKAEVEPKVKPESRKALTSTFLRLVAHGVTPMDVLLESAALSLLSEWKPWIVADDMHLTRTLGTQVCYLAPRNTKTVWVNGKRTQRYPFLTHGTRHAVGASIRGALGSLLKNIAHSCIRKVQKDEDGVKAMRAEFSI